MSKVVKVAQSDYKVKVRDGGNIYLDTGDLVGTVVVSGDLQVKGTTTTVESTVVTIADNIITLAAGNTAAGIPASLDYKAGIEIDRGSLPTASMTWDEQPSWDIGSVSGNGLFSFEINGEVRPIRTNGIKSDGNLYLVQAGLGVVTVQGTNNYEQQVFRYNDQNEIEVDPVTFSAILDDDAIPNAKGVADYVDFTLANTFQDSIASGGPGTSDTDGGTYVTARDNSQYGERSVVRIGINQLITERPMAEFFDNEIILDELNIRGTTISTWTSNEDLILSAPGAGSVKVDDNLLITLTPDIEDGLVDPSSTTEGTKIYAKTEAGGRTGLYFVNNTGRQGELVSNNRALLYSMIF